MAGKNSFVLYVEYLQNIELLSMEQRGELFTAIMHYASGKRGRRPRRDGNDGVQLHSFTNGS